MVVALSDAPFDYMYAYYVVCGPYVVVGKEDGLDDEQMNNRCVLAGQEFGKEPWGYCISAFYPFSCADDFTYMYTYTYTYLGTRTRR